MGGEGEVNKWVKDFDCTALLGLSIPIEFALSNSSKTVP